MYKYLFWLGASFGLSMFLFFYMGFYNFAANDPHWSITSKIIVIARNNAIERVAKNIQTPNLSDAALINMGAQDYHEMCVSCHSSPLQKNLSDLHQGLYPTPPLLTKTSQFNTNQQFWIIKNGLKMTGMPAWGISHDDKRIWAMVAFIQQLPKLDANQYQILSARTIASSSDKHTQESVHE